MEQIRTLTALLDYAKEVGPMKISVACAEDAEVMEAVEAARKAGVATAYLVGNADAIKAVTDKLGIDLANYDVVDEKGGEAAAALKAVELVSEGKAQIVMKGMVATANFLRGVLNKEKGLRTGATLSHVYIHEIDGYDRIFFISDPAFNTYPDIKGKVDITNNVVKLAHAFGVAMPKVAALAAVEVVNPDMPPTMDAALLTQMNRRGQIKGCLIDGPLALDNAVSPESAAHKGIKSEVAGYADILIVPNIESGNMLAKAIVYFAKNKTAGIVLGAKAPIVLTSRADSAEAKLLSIASAVALAAHQAKK
ncbi:phosphate butyryltransferase [Synergistaceae bacterium OttesenSCG-928-D05]|nr:phosphate butyryltransferase [Synergistaceae bacterium OttesenSCG-928-D05]